MKVIQLCARCWLAWVFLVTILRLDANLPASGTPVIFAVSNSAPIEGAPAWITAGVTDTVSLASVTLVYTTGANPAPATTNFLETMSTNTSGISPWTGSGYHGAAH